MSDDTIPDRTQVEQQLALARSHANKMLSAYAGFKNEDPFRGNPTLVISSVTNDIAEGGIVRAVAEDKLTDEDRALIESRVSYYVENFDIEMVDGELTSDSRGTVLAMAYTEILEDLPKERGGVFVALSLRVNTLFAYWEKLGIISKDIVEGKLLFVLTLSPKAVGTATLAALTLNESALDAFRQDCTDLTVLCRRYLKDVPNVRVFGLFRKSEKGVVTAYMVYAPHDESPYTSAEQLIQKKMAAFVDDQRAVTFQKAQSGFMKASLDAMPDGGIEFVENAHLVRAMMVATSDLRTGDATTTDIVLSESSEEPNPAFVKLYLGTMADVVDEYASATVQ